MKKIFLLFMSLTVLSSCSNDDDSVETSDDQILGTWYIAEINNAGSLPISINECTSQSNITFNSDYTATSEYYTGSNLENCSVEEDEGAWSNDENSKYTFRIPYLGPREGRVEFSGESEFTFYPDDLQNPNSDEDPNIVFEKR